MGTNFKEKYNKIQGKISAVEKELKQLNGRHARKIADSHLDDILNIKGVEGCRILESGSPESGRNRNIKICIKLSEKAQEPNQKYLDKSEDKYEEYFSFDHSNIPSKIKNIIGEEYQDTLGLYITDNWKLSKPASWEELIAEKII